MDKNGHGTHVAGTIAALRNEIGVVGAAPEAHLYALKVFGDSGSADYDDIVAAIQRAAENGIKITNNSYGSKGNPGTLVEQAFINTYDNDMLHVAAAGNEGNPRGIGDNVIYPARFSSVIAVAASTSSDSRASFSSTGPAVELIAPGASINSTIPGGGYGVKSGTSMASPHVAGVAALVWAADSSLSNTQVRNILQQTAQNLWLNANHQGYGLVRADSAVAAVAGSNDPDTYTLTVDKVGEGSIKVDDVQINLPYNKDYDDGVIVNLEAIADSGWQFDKWIIKGQESFNAKTTVTMDAEKTATAYFSLIPQDPDTYTLTVDKVGEGSIKVDDVQIILPYNKDYDDGVIVNLEAIADSGWQFDKWIINGQESSNAITTVTMNAEKTATAYFSQVQSTGLNISITSPEEFSNYTWNSWVDINVMVIDKNEPNMPIEGINVTVTVNIGSGTTYQGTTNADGKFTARYRVANKTSPGNYTIEAQAYIGEVIAGDDIISFTITGR